ncbi:hypothetical protein RJ641_022581, partial [Dillenia turbinata]
IPSVAKSGVESKLAIFEIINGRAHGLFSDAADGISTSAWFMPIFVLLLGQRNPLLSDVNIFLLYPGSDDFPKSKGTISTRNRHIYLKLKDIMIAKKQRIASILIESRTYPINCTRVGDFNLHVRLCGWKDDDFGIVVLLTRWLGGFVIKAHDMKISLLETDFYTPYFQAKKKKKSCKPTKALVQGKLTSMYHYKFSKANNGFCKSLLNSKGNGSEDCVLVEKTHSFHTSSMG